MSRNSVPAHHLDGLEVLDGLDVPDLRSRVDARVAQGYTVQLLQEVSGHVKRLKRIVGVAAPAFTAQLLEQSTRPQHIFQGRI